MTTYQVSVTYQTTQDYVPGRTQGFRVVMTATVVSGFADAGIFVYQTVASGIVEFQCIACPSQLVDLPLNAPTPTSNGWFRMAGLDMTFQAQSEGQEFIASCLSPLDGYGNQGEVWTLCSEMDNLANNLSIPVTQVIG